MAITVSGGSAGSSKDDAVPKVDLGTAVRIRLSGRSPPVEGVVTGVVKPFENSAPGWRDPAPHLRYWVQCDGWQDLVRLRDIQVDAW